MKRLSLLAAVVVSLALAFTVQSAATKSTGTLKVATPGIGLDLKIAGKPVPVPNGKDVPMPPGTYATAGITCAAKGKDTPEIWTIKAASAFGKLKEIVITEGQVTTVEAGQPLTLKAGVNSTKNKDGSKVVLVALTIVGKAEEVYNAGTIMKGMTRAAAPQLQILDESGKVLSQGNFEYG